MASITNPSETVFLDKLLMLQSHHYWYNLVAQADNGNGRAVKLKFQNREMYLSHFDVGIVYWKTYYSDTIDHSSTS